MCLLSFRRAVDGEEQRRPPIRPGAASLQIWLNARTWLRAGNHLRDHGHHTRVRRAELARTRQRRATLLHLAQSRIVSYLYLLPLHLYPTLYLKLYLASAYLSSLNTSPYI